MKQNNVIRVDLPHNKARTKILKLIAHCPGVNSVTIRQQLNQLVIVGDEIGSVKLMWLLRKKFRFAEAISISPPEHNLGRKGRSSRMKSLKAKLPDPPGLWPFSLKEDESLLNLSNSGVDEFDVYGRNDDAKRVIELLMSDECSRRRISVISIVGNTGVGKTTFASLLYKNSTVCQTFEKKFWVSANESFDIIGLLKEVLESVAGVSCDFTELTDFQEALREVLVDKRFFIVLDDVCNKQLGLWSSLLVPMSVGAIGSVVLVTSRNELEATDIDINMMYSYELNPLSEEDCWFIFQQCAFGMKKRNIPERLKGIGLKIIGMCEGLPLAVKAIGGLLQSELNEDLWNAILKSDTWYTEDNLPALRLCYDLLPLNLKRCIYCCSLFPKGYIFEKEHLVRLWMSQGFIEHEEGKSDRDACGEYLNELLRRSFIQYSPICGPSEKKFLMHDLVNHLAYSSPENKCFRAESCKLHNVPADVHHVAVSPDMTDTAVEFEYFKKPTDIHTFLLVNRSVAKFEAGIFLIKNPSLLNDLLHPLRFLRTLDLSFTNIEVLPDSIAYLRELRYLALNRTYISSLPSSICNLQHLQSLEIQGCNFLSELPAGIEGLTNLQHLDVWKECGFVSMPQGIGKLTGLKTLSTFTVGSDRQHCRISELAHMVSISGSLCVGGIWNVASGAEASGARLEMKQNIQALTLQWFNTATALKGDQSSETAFEILQNLQPYFLIEKLTIRDYLGNLFPAWISDPAFFKLRSITLENCYECDVLPPLGNLPSLKHLTIGKLDSLRCVNQEFRGSIARRAFPALETMKLIEMIDLESWCGVEDEDFPFLCSLAISRCDRLVTLPCFKNLKVLEINSCNDLISLGPLHWFTSLERLRVNRCKKLRITVDERLPSKLHTVETGPDCDFLHDWHPSGFDKLASCHQVRWKLVRQSQEASNSADLFYSKTENCLRRA